MVIQILGLIGELVAFDLHVINDTKLILYDFWDFDVFKSFFHNF